MSSRAEELVAASRRMVDGAEGSAAEKAEMLTELAAGLQLAPKTAYDLHAALQLYGVALDLCPESETLLRARTRARRATALMAVPDDETALLREAREEFEAVLPVLAAAGGPAETAEAEMNLGLVIQSLAGVNKARIQDAISAYQRALRVFDRARHPQEYAILQSNLATAFLSIPFSDARAKLREALAVQAFEEGLAAINLIDHPREYAMLQNNLGNALQYAASSHPVENRLRALEAYDEALRVRDPRLAPGEYANTIANKANCLADLPDDPERPEAGNPERAAEALALFRQAERMFRDLGETGKAASVREAICELERGAPAMAAHAGAPRRDQPAQEQSACIF